VRGRSTATLAEALRLEEPGWAESASAVFFLGFFLLASSTMHDICSVLQRWQAWWSGKGRGLEGTSRSGSSQRAFRCWHIWHERLAWVRRGRF
jgi:hypothetical protein